MVISTVSTMLRIKKGVRIPPASAYATIVSVAESVYRDHGYDCIITSGIEGDHGHSSEHFKGDAADFRIRHLDEGDEQIIKHDLTEALGFDFDVVLEDTHIHVEYDPKVPINRG
jgi:hypothetical protein